MKGRKQEMVERKKKLTVSVNKVDAFVNKNGHVVLCQLLVTQLSSVGVRFVLNHGAPNLRLPRRSHDKVASVRWAVDQHRRSLLDQKVVRRVVALLQPDATRLPQVEDFQTRFGKIVENKLST